MKKQLFIRVTAIIIVVIFLLITVGSVAFAGDGSGGGKNNPLMLEESTPADGEKDVEVDSEIKLIFSKNVVNMAVKENNIKCISLIDSEGNIVPTEIVLADDQMESEKRNDVVIKPNESLEEGMEYTIVVSKDMSSKSGVTIGKDIKISFKTKGETTSRKIFLWILIVLVIILDVLYIKKKRNKHKK